VKATRRWQSYLANRERQNGLLEAMLAADLTAGILLLIERMRRMAGEIALIATNYTVKTIAGILIRTWPRTTGSRIRKSRKESAKKPIRRRLLLRRRPQRLHHRLRRNCPQKLNMRIKPAKLTNRFGLALLRNPSATTLI
jgi:hypothetical protein